MEINLCLGSSCYSRGNREILDTLEQIIQEQHLEDRVSLKGAHCLGQCSKGPVILINQQQYKKLHPSCIRDILMHHLEEEL